MTWYKFKSYHFRLFLIFFCKYKAFSHALMFGYFQLLERQRGRSSICWFTLQIPATGRVGPGEPGAITPSRSIMQVAGLEQLDEKTSSQDLNSYSETERRHPTAA